MSGAAGRRRDENPEDPARARAGARIRRARRRRGLSLAATAGLIGRSKGWLSMIENGQLQLDRLSDIVALASILEVPALVLTGIPCPGCPRTPGGGGGR